jgi:hypothetical protein
MAVDALAYRNLSIWELAVERNQKESELPNGRQSYWLNPVWGDTTPSPLKNPALSLEEIFKRRPSLQTGIPEWRQTLATMSRAVATPFTILFLFCSAITILAALLTKLRSPEWVLMAYLSFQVVFYAAFLSAFYFPFSRYVQIWQPVVLLVVVLVPAMLFCKLLGWRTPNRSS